VCVCVCLGVFCAQILLSFLDLSKSLCIFLHGFVTARCCIARVGFVFVVSVGETKSNASFLHTLKK